MSYSDPVCIMFIQKQGQWFELGRTEKIKDTLIFSVLPNSKNQSIFDSSL